jgi:predicted DNA-binding transcriptional regulator AlpA
MIKHLLTYATLVHRGIFNNRTTLRRAIKNYGFPEPNKLGERRVLWDAAEVDCWLPAGVPRHRTPTLSTPSAYSSLPLFRS